MPRGYTRGNDYGSTALGKYLCLIVGVARSINISVCKGRHCSVCSYSRSFGVFRCPVSSVGFHTCEVDQVGAVPRDPESSTQVQKDFFSFLVAVDRLIAGKLSCGRSSNFLNPTRPQHRSLYSSHSNRASFFPDHLPGTLSQPHAAAACWPCCPLPHLGCR